jgi:hypothetical protein
MLRSSVCLALVACVRAIYVVNVTFTGVAVGVNLTLPSNWTLSITGDTLIVKSGACPKGFYCPPNTQTPIPCRPGTRNVNIKRTTECSDLCLANWYCPDGVSYTKCPEHTTSPPGSSSKLQCICSEAGYQCTYSKEVQLHILLQLPLQQWLGSQLLRDKFVEIVAKASGVRVENVHIQQVLPHLGNRRLLSLRHGKTHSKTGSKMGSSLTTLVRATVVGAVEVKGLDSILAQHRLFRGSTLRNWPVSRLVVSNHTRSVSVE